MNLSRQDRDPGSGLQRGLVAWVLWVLASVIGGAILALVAEPLEILGFLLLPGVILWNCAGVGAETLPLLPPKGI